MTKELKYLIVSRLNPFVFTGLFLSFAPPHEAPVYHKVIALCYHAFQYDRFRL